jgi:large subunit ribosomal protein L22
VSTTEFTARHRFAGITARKARRIADMIRGRNVNEALELLQFAPQRGAAFYLKVVRSAVANASLDENVKVERLYISDCRADDGPLLNGRMRFRPGPQGRAMPFAKRLSHLTVKVRPTEDVEGAPKRVQSRSRGKTAKGAPSATAASEAPDTGSKASTTASKAPTAGSKAPTAGSKSSESKPARKKASPKKAEGPRSEEGEA